MTCVTVLGGAAAGGNSGMGSSGLLVTSATTSIVLDLGPGTLPELRKQTDYRSLDGIVISHLHLDHTLDLGALRYALAYNPVPAGRRISLFMPPQGIAFLERFTAVYADEGEGIEFFADQFDIHCYDPARQLDIGDLSISFTPTVHYRPCWAMRLSSPNSGDLFYTADTGPAAHLERAALGSALIIAEATNLDAEGETFHERGHLTAGEAGQLATDAGAEALIITHIWEERGFAPAAAMASKTFSGTLYVAHPGLTVEF